MVDSLSLLFIGLILVISVPISIFSLGYLKEYAKEYSIFYHVGLMIIFIICMCGVVLAADSLVFMLFWEGMSISSFFLVIFEYRKPESLKAGLLYFIMTRISGLTLLIMFALLYRYTGSLSFEAIRAAAPAMTTVQRDTISILAIIGFGAKAGLVPLHAWLPRAHPAAPANISALMSGLMIKIALYGFIRVIFGFVQVPSISIGVTVMLVGAITGFYAIVNGMVQDDLKKLLGYSSAENIGLIFATVGLSMIMFSLNVPNLAVLALTAAVFHTINHAVFKSLLFTTAGSVQFATGTRNINQLGGLYKTMKFATICAFIGTAAVAAVPPLNGFASEIIIFQSFIQSGTILNDGTQSPLVLAIFLAGIFLAFTSAAAMYTAVKGFGITFLSNPRSEKAKNIHPLPLVMNIGLGILAGYAILLGITAPFMIQFFASIVAPFMGYSDIPEILPIGYEIIPVSILLIVILLVLIGIGKKKTKEPIESNISWACGFNRLKPFMQYSGTGFTQPILRIAPYAVGYTKKVIKDNKNITVSHSIIDLIEVHLYRPVALLITNIAMKISKFQLGRIHIYLLYMLSTLAIVLLSVYYFI